MAYRNPVFYGRHYIRDAVELGSPTVITTVHPFDANFPATNICDDLNGRLAKFGSSQSNHAVIFDRGAASNLGRVTIMVIPSGHNMSGITLTVTEDNDPFFGSPNTIFSSASISAGLNVFTGGGGLNPAERYIAINFNGTGQWQFGEIVLSNAASITRGPRPDWRRVPVNNTFQSRTRGAVSYSRVLSSVRDRWELGWDSLKDTDKTVLEGILDSVPHASHPFWLVPPDDDLPDAINVQLVRDAEYRQGSSVPQALITQGVRLQFEEVLG